MTQTPLLTEMIRLGTRHRRSAYGVIVAVWLTGALALALSWLKPGAAGFDPLVMRVHGAAAMGFMMLLGSLQGHMSRAWQLRRNRASGGFLLGLCLFFVITGWLLYYSGNETVRNLTSVAHWALGLGFPLPLVGHIALGRARARARLRGPGTLGVAAPEPRTVGPVPASTQAVLT